MTEDPSPADSNATPHRPWWRRVLFEWVVPLLGVALVVHAVGWLRAPDLPEAAPPFTLKSLDGEEISLASLAGRPVVLNFWATWCAPCRVEIPSFSRYARNHPDVVVLGIVADGPASKVRRVAADLGVDYPVLLGDRATLAAYGVQVFPTTVIVDRDGRVSTAHTGLMLGPQLTWATWGL